MKPASSNSNRMVAMVGSSYIVQQPEYMWAKFEIPWVWDNLLHSFIGDWSTAVGKWEDHCKVLVHLLWLVDFTGGGCCLCKRSIPADDKANEDEDNRRQPHKEYTKKAFLHSCSPPLQCFSCWQNDDDTTINYYIMLIVFYPSQIEIIILLKILAEASWGCSSPVDIYWI